MLKQSKLSQEKQNKKELKLESEMMLYCKKSNKPVDYEYLLKSSCLAQSSDSKYFESNLEMSKLKLEYNLFNYKQEDLKEARKLFLPLFSKCQ